MFNYQYILMITLVITLAPLMSRAEITSSPETENSRPLKTRYARNLELPQGAEVRILQIDKTKKMVLVESVKFPGEDHSWLRAKEFAESIKVDPKLSIRKKGEIKRLSQIIVGKTYTLNKKIPTYVANQK